MPTSCWDLQQMGQKVNGFFLVKGSKKMEMIYCDFYPNQNGTTSFSFTCYCSSKSFLLTEKQKWIGYVDVKSTPVHFYVQRNDSFSTEYTPIPFELAQVNEGNAMDMTSGIFTAPRPGIYFFSFTGSARLSSSSSDVYLGSRLYLNGNRIGSSLVREENKKGKPVDQKSPLTLQSTLNLKTGDRLWVQIDYSFSSYLFDSDAHFTHFTGFMLEEEIAASL
jgi:hypothetical protein